MDKVSVLMSSFNEKREFISIAIESILSQTYNNIEFIIVIDNPTNSEINSIINEYANKDNRIVVVKNRNNLGLTASLNHGLSVATGTYIARMDADDISDPNRLEEQLKYIEANDLDLVGCMTRRISESGEIVNALTNISHTPQYLSKKLMYDNCIAHPTWLAKRQVYDTLRYRDIKTAEDYDFLLRAKKAGFKLGICDKCLFSYRVNTMGISRSNSLRQMLTSHILQKEYCKLVSINQEYIDSKIVKYLSVQSNSSFERGVRLVDKSVEQIKHKNPAAIITTLRALCSSRFIWIKLYKIFKLHTISV